jgi:prepilin peptidase CpaA
MGALMAPATWAAPVLGLLLALAVWSDLRKRRIPNGLVLAGLALALVFQGAAAPGTGLFAHPSGGIGLPSGLAGAAVGLLVPMPFYAWRLLGAGDVKLLAMVGAWLGPAQAAGAILLTMLAGGVLALIFALCTGVLAKALANAREMATRMLVLGLGHAGDAPAATGRLPYAFAIAAGTAAQIQLAGSTAWALFST